MSSPFEDISVWYGVILICLEILLTRVLTDEQSYSILN